MKYKNILVLAAFLVAPFLYSAGPIATVAPDRTKLVFDRPWTREDISSNKFFTSSRLKFSEADFNDLVKEYEGKTEIPLALPYCKETEGLEEAAFVQESSYVIIQKEMRAVTSPLCPCILVMVTYPPFDQSLVMHLHFNNRLEDVVKIIQDFVPPHKKEETCISMFTKKYDPKGSTDAAFDKVFIDESNQKISQKSAIILIKNQLENSGFTRSLIPALIDNSPSWNRPLVFAGSAYLAAQRGVVVSCDGDQNGWKIETVCPGTECFFKQSANFPCLTAPEYEAACRSQELFLRKSGQHDPKEIEFGRENGYLRIIKKDPTPMRVFFDAQPS